jgi:hypothetical protein
VLDRVRDELAARALPPVEDLRGSNSKQDGVER